MSKKTKKQVSYRLDQQLLSMLDYLSGQYKRLSATDIADLSFKYLLIDVLDDLINKKGEGADRLIGQYVSGELDDRIQALHDRIFE